MRTFTIIAMAFLFLFVGVPRFAQADEKPEMVVETKGEAKAKAETEKEIAEMKALAEKAKQNQAKGTMEPAKGKTRATGESVKAPAEQPKAKTEY